MSVKPQVVDFSLCEDRGRAFDRYHDALDAINANGPQKRIRVPVRSKWTTSASGIRYRIGEHGNLLYEVPDIPHARIVRAVEILAEVQTQPGFKPHHFFKHPELADINSRVLKKKIDEYLGRDPVATPKKGADGGSTDERPRVWAAKDLDPARPKKWLARQRIPWGQMTIMVGDEGIGKSLFWVWIVAAVTTGKPLPEFGIPARDPQHVRLIVTEDDWATDVRPRLELAGVNLDYVSLVAARQDGTGTPVFPSEDMELLYEDPVPALVIVDALADTVAPEINMSNAVSARILLSQWAEYATRAGAAVLILSHTNRMTDAAQARDRYGISAELRKKARMTLFAQLDDDGVLLVGPEKSNGSSPVQASRFNVEPVQVRTPTDDDDGTVARVVYVGESTKTARQKAEEKKPEFADWLRDLLSEGPVASAEVAELAKRDGVSAYQLKVAKEYLLVDSYKAKEFQGQWYMRLPRGMAG
ncbi:AAA family ATPase [Mycobacterium sp. NPDC003449]